MPVNITCRHTEIDEVLHGLVVKKVRNLKRYFEKVDKIDVIFTAEKHRRMCEIIVHAAPFDIAAQAENSSEGHAFDKALKAVQRQIKDSKDRMVQRGRRSRRGSAANASGLAEAV